MSLLLLDIPGILACFSFSFLEKHVQIGALVSTFFFSTGSMEEGGNGKWEIMKGKEDYNLVLMARQSNVLDERAP